jgi:hypothetical protein
MNYEKKINKLARQAENKTDLKIGSQRKKNETQEAWAERWNIYFHNAINEMAAMAGLRGTRKHPVK